MTNLFLRRMWVVCLTALGGASSELLLAQEPRVVIKHSTSAGEINGSLSPLGTMQLHNDAATRRLLRDGRAKIEAGQFAEGIIAIQRLLDRGDDGFFRPQNQRDWTSLRLEALATFSSLPPEGLATLEKLFGSQARQLFDQARERGRSPDVAEVLRRFFHTQAGFDAACWQAMRWLEQGEVTASARLFDRVLNEAAHRQRVTDRVRWQAAVAHRMSGHDARVAEVLAQITAETLTIGGEPVRRDEWLEKLPSARTSAVATGAPDWAQPAGGPTRNMATTGTAPWLNPRWTQPLFGHPDEGWLLTEWLRRQQNEIPPLLSMAHQPLVVGNVVVVRSTSNVHAIDLQTGKPLWRCRMSISLPDLIRTFTLGPLDLGTPIAVEDAFVGNSARGTLSSDGRFVFAVDEILPQRRLAPAKDTPNPNDTEHARVWTRLLALPLAAPASTNGDVTEARPAWVLNGTDLGMKLAGADHAVQFLGPPVVFDGQLFALVELFSVASFDTEKVGQLSLVALDPANGSLLWTQGLALVDQPFFRMDQRFRRNPVGVPSAADGMLICSMDFGLILGVDLVSGRQRWVYDTGGKTTDVRATVFRETPGWQGSPAWPVIHQGRVLLMPRDSDHLHCLDLQTGQLVWKLDRGSAQAIGTVTNDWIILLGDQDVEAIPFSRSTTNPGRQSPGAWRHQLGQITGSGVRLGDQYLVPLQAGRIAALEIATGRERGFSLRRTTDALTTEDGSPDAAIKEHPETWLGNLIAAPNTILSLNALELVAFPQAEAVLKSIPASSETVEHKLLRSELSMLMETRQSSVDELWQIASESLAPQLKQQAEQQLRELLFLELDRQPQRAEEFLRKLTTLAKTPTERARLLRRECEFWLTSHPSRTVRAAQELAASPLQQDLNLDESGRHLVSKQTWARNFMRQAWHRLQQRPEQMDEVLDTLNQQRDRLVSSRDLSAMRRFVQLCEDWPQAIDVRFRLADLLSEQGDWQEAELLLLRARQHADPRIVAEASVRLLRLWSDAGLHSFAANMLSELNERLADVPIRLAVTATNAPNNEAPTVVTGRSFVASFPRDSLTWAAWARHAKPSWTIRRVEISEDRALAGSSRITESYSNITKPFRTSAGCSASMFEKSAAFQTESELSWHVVEKDTGTLLGRMTGMDRVWYPSSQSALWSTASGHLLPLGGPGRMRGVSLLERSDSSGSWENLFAPLAATEEFPRVGPSGADFVVFQTRQHLLVLDPANGQLRWRRSHLEPHSGLFAENDWGLFGDSEALVLFEQDGSTYTVFETATGRELRRGKLTLDLQQNRRTFGRRLFHFAQDRVPDPKLGEGQVRLERRVRIWDPQSDRLDWDDSAPDRTHWSTTSDGELLLVQSNGRIRILDVAALQTKLDVQLSPTAIAAASMVRAFSDHERYFINIQRGLSDQTPTRLNYYANDVQIPKSDIQGELYAFRRPARAVPFGEAHGTLGQQLWLRYFLQRTVLRFDQSRLPFLICATKQQDPKNNSRVSLKLDALDAETGSVIGSHDHLPPGRIVQVQFDPDEIRLIGLQTGIHIRFDRDRQKLATTDDPL